MNSRSLEDRSGLVGGLRHLQIPLYLLWYLPFCIYISAKHTHTHILIVSALTYLKVFCALNLSIRNPQVSEKLCLSTKVLKDYSPPPPPSLLLCRYLDQQVVSEQEVHKPSALNLDPQIGEGTLSLSEDYIICV